MQQIYYTQCPVGYGLGASNGFQIKRRTEHYPLGGDFRHLGMRTFIPGTRTLAPCVLRYRRDADGVAEVARLTPRAQEYHTERGPWGRPGGVFAHAIRLEASEFAAINGDTQALRSADFWRTNDPEPTLGREPEPLAWPPAIPPTRPELNGLDAGRLAQLLTGAAAAAREGRTLFVIAEPDRLADLIGLVVWSFPPGLRPDLTFSTYHDRPEELPSYRIQGTTAAARPARPALLAVGWIADVAVTDLEPALAVPRWAETLAGWVVSDDEEARAMLADSRRVFPCAEPDDPPAQVWSDRRMNAWVDVVRISRRPDLPAPASAEDWLALAWAGQWAGRRSLSGPWLEARGAGWWAESALALRGLEARRAMVVHARLGSAWAAPADPTSWGLATAGAGADADASERDAVVIAMLNAAPVADRPGFVAALLNSLSPDLAGETLARLRTEPACDRGMLLPVEVPAAVDALGAGDSGPLREVVREALTRRGVVGAVFDAVANWRGIRPDLARFLTSAVGGEVARCPADQTDEAYRWALERGGLEAAIWLATDLRERLASPRADDAWRALRDRTPTRLRPALAEAVLTVAADPTLPDEGFRWWVDHLLLRLTDTAVPDDPGWPARYLARSPSDFELLKRLYMKPYRVTGLSEWLEQARSSSALPPEAVARLANLRVLARALRSGDARAMVDVNLAIVPSLDRGPILEQALARVDSGRLDVLELILGACRDAWPDGLGPGAAGLAQVGSAIAGSRWLLEAAPHPKEWLARVDRILAMVAHREAGATLEPDGLGAMIIADTTRRLEAAAAWALRRELINHTEAWSGLTEDLARDLSGRPVVQAADLVEQWDARLPKDPWRFSTLVLNACDGPRRVAVVSARIADLKTIVKERTIPWWGSRLVPNAPSDIREALARESPMRPLDSEALDFARSWMNFAAPNIEAANLDNDFAEEHKSVPARSSRRESPLSPEANLRWQCLEALSSMARPGNTSEGRGQTLVEGSRKLPPPGLREDDLHQFVAQAIACGVGLDPIGIEKWASWLVKSAGLRDADRLGRWTTDLAESDDLEPAVQLERAPFVADLRAEIKRVLRDLRQ